MIERCATCPLKRDCSVLDALVLSPQTVTGLKERHGWTDETIVFEVLTAARTAKGKHCPAPGQVKTELYKIVDGAGLNGLGKPTKESVRALLTPRSNTKKM